MRVSRTKKMTAVLSDDREASRSSDRTAVIVNACGGARGLLHAGPGSHGQALLTALGDESWRVREMALKVIAKHDVPDPDSRVETLVHDPVSRVRNQAWRALGVPSPEER
jgi:HEAT repeat